MSHRFLLRRFQKAHCQIHFSACSPQPAFATAIQAFCKDGDILQARKLFDEMPEKNVFAFSAMIYGYASNGFYSNSLFLFFQMLHLNIFPNSYTFVAVLLASAGLRSLKITGYIHGRIFRTGLESDTFVISALLNSYSKSGAVADAYRLFSEIDRPSLVSWNAMIAGFIQNGHFEESFLLFERLRETGIMPNCITMMSVMQGCIDFCSLSVCESIHGFVVKAGFEYDVSLMNSLLVMYSSFGNLDIVKAFFMKMAAKDVITWTNMMCFMLQFACPSKALQLYSQMRCCGINADTVAMANVITACALLGDLSKAMSVHGQIITHGFDSELSVLNSLITMYSRCKDLGTACMLFKKTTCKSLVSWTAMMFGYLCNFKPRYGIDLLIRMRREETFSLDSVTLICSLASSSELANLELCKQLHAYSFKSNLIICIDVQNCLISVYGRCGSTDLAYKVFKEMIHKDIVSFNAMISSYGINGEGKQALALFHEMGRHCEKPDSITFLNVLNACSHSGMVDEGLLVFEKMLMDKRIIPRGEHYGCLVDVLARAGRLEDARKFADIMQEEFASTVWKALLGGCYLNVDPGLAEVAVKRVFESSSGDASHFVVLSNVYASVGRFDHVESLRASFGNKGLVKNLGFSMIDSLSNVLVEAGVA